MGAFFLAAVTSARLGRQAMIRMQTVRSSRVGIAQDSPRPACRSMRLSHQWKNANGRLNPLALGAVWACVAEADNPRQTQTGPNFRVEQSPCRLGVSPWGFHPIESCSDGQLPALTCLSDYTHCQICQISNLH